MAALPFLIVALAGTLLVVILLRPYSSPAAQPQTMPFSYAGLILSSVLGLYLELLLIRWISSEIRIFAYFKNFVLIACFLGFGLGCYLCRRAVSVAALVMPLVFLSALVELPWRPLRQVVAALPVLLGATSEVQIWGVGTSALTPGAFVGLLLAAMVTLPLFALLAVAFIPIGQLVGFYLESAPRGIAAYTVNVVASLAGIALYTALCFANQPPLTWMIVAGVLAVVLFALLPVGAAASGARPGAGAATLVAVGFAVCIALIALGPDRNTRTLWSPYQKLQLRELTVNDEHVGYELMTNSSWFQKILDFSPRFVAAHPQIFREDVRFNSFNIPYGFVPHPQSVLVLGSGMGNDVAAALRNGAQHVTAVDIDPLIVRLGRELHPERPYASPRVTAIVDDARSYVQNARGQFDVIVFSALDSHTTSSHFSNIRIDNYVYTVQAMRAAKALLRPDGIFVVRFQVQRPWIAGRLHDTLAEAFGYEPLQMQVGNEAGVYSTGGRFFVTGSPQRIVAALQDPQFGAFIRSRPRLPMERVPVATDDWPYFYQRDRGLPTSVVTISLLLLVVCFLAARRIGLRFASLRLELFFLGAGFMLLESQIISRMALLFGTTWVVNSIVIAVLLLLIVAANGVASVGAAALGSAPTLGYAAIILSIAAAYVVPLETFFFRSFALKAIVATLFLCLPVFFAGIVFIKRFAAAGFAAEAIGSNLLGSLAGGIVESLSLWLGLRSLLLIAICFYAAAWLASRGRSFTFHFLH